MIVGEEHSHRHSVGVHQSGGRVAAAVERRPNALVGEDRADLAQIRVAIEKLRRGGELLRRALKTLMRRAEKASTDGESSAILRPGVTASGGGQGRAGPAGAHVEHVGVGPPGLHSPNSWLLRERH